MENRIKVMPIFGTRPEAIKMFPVVHALQKISEFDIKICVTGQHRRMLDQVLTLAHISADIDLDVMEANQTLELPDHAAYYPTGQGIRRAKARSGSCSR